MTPTPPTQRSWRDCAALQRLTCLLGFSIRPPVSGCACDPLPPLTPPTTESAAVGSNTNPYPSEYDRTHLHVLWRAGVQALKLVQGALQEAERSFEEQRVPCPFAGAWLPSNQMSAQTHSLDTRTERHL